MYRLKLNYIAKCRRHPGYRPENGGQAIKAGCRQCQGIWKIWEAEVRLRTQIEEYEKTADDYGQVLDFPIEKEHHAHA